MDWNALLIGLIAGLAGGVVAAAVSIIAVPLQAEAEVESEERSARRAWRLNRITKLMTFLEVVERYHSSTMLRRQLPLMRERIRPYADALGISGEQLNAFDLQIATERAPLPDWISMSTEYWGPVIAFEDPEVSNHLLMLLMDLSSPKDEQGEGELRADQRTMLLWRSRFHIERFVSLVPARRRSIFGRLTSALALRGPEWENVPTFDNTKMQRLRDEINAMEAPSPER